MRKWLFLFLLIVVMLLVNARTEKVTMKIGDSFYINGANVSLVSTDDKDDKIIVCVNNVKSIVSDEKKVNGIRVEILSVFDNHSRLELENPCRDCVCDEDCDNNLCFDKIIERVECRVNSDCGDRNDNTDNLCINNECVYREKVREIKVEEPSEITVKLKEKKGEDNTLLIATISIIALLIVLLIILRLRK